MPSIDLGSVVGPAGAQGPQGATGATGAQGPSGPNQVSASTSTTLVGILKGNGTVVGVATVDSEPDATHPDNLITSAGVAGELAKEILVVNFGTLTGTGSAVTVSKSDAAITADHVLLYYELGTPSAQVGAITITTSAGAVSASGNINGSTTLKVVLGKQGKSIS